MAAGLFATGTRSVRGLLCGAALFAFVALAVGAGGAPEVEPNDTLGQATPATIGESMNGTCSGNSDVIAYNLSAGRRIWVDYNFSNYARITLWSPSNAQLLDEPIYISPDSFGFTTYATGTYSLAMGCASSNYDWNVTFSDAGAAAVQLPNGEREPNDDSSTATLFSGTAAYRGSVNSTYDEFDIWHIDVPTITFIEISIDSLSDDVRLATVLNDEPYSYRGHTYFVGQVSPPGLDFAVVALDGEHDYDLTLRFEGNPEVYFEGEDEAEPNGGTTNATPIAISAAMTIAGYTDEDYDTHDYYRVLSAQAVVLTVRVQTDGDACYTLFDCQEIGFHLANGTAGVDINGSEIYFDQGEFILAAGVAYFIDVHVDAAAGHYNLSLTPRGARVTAGAVVELIAAQDAEYIRAVARGATEYSSTAEFDLSSLGDGVLFGECLNLWIINREPVAITVNLRAGTHWNASVLVVGNYYSTRDQSISLGPGEEKTVAIFAAAEGTAGLAASSFTTYWPDGMATGPVAQVLNETASGTYSAQAEAIALWAAGESLSRSDLQTWSAPDSAIDEAARIHQEAGVSSTIGGPLGIPIDGALFAIIGAMIALAVVAVVVAVVVSRRRKAASIPPPAGSFAGGAPGAPGAATSVAAMAPMAPQPQPAPAAWQPQPAPPQPQPAPATWQPQPAPPQPAPATWQPQPAPPQPAPVTWQPQPAPPQPAPATWQPQPAPPQPAPAAWQPPPAPQPQPAPAAWQAPAGAAPVPAPPKKGRFFSRAEPQPIPQIIEEVELTCPKCNASRREQDSYCTICGEFFR